MTIGDRIKARRIELGLTQADLAHKLGDISKPSISTVENNKETLSVARLKRYAEALSTTPAQLMGEEEANDEFSANNAHLIAKIRADKNLVNALEKYFSLSETEQQHIIDMINLLAR